MNSWSKGIHHSDPVVRGLAIKDLITSGEEDRLAILSSLLDRETNLELKYELKRSINELISKTGNDEILRKSSQAELRKAFLGTDKEIQKRACHFAAKARRFEFLPVMLKIEKSLNDSYVKICNLHLMRHKPEQYLKDILHYLNDQDSLVLVAAIESLAYIGNTACLATIARFTFHETERVRSVALKALKEQGESKLLVLFTRLSESHYDAYREAAAHSISALRFEAGVKYLLQLLRDSSESVVVAATKALRNLADEDCEEAKNALAGNISQKQSEENQKSEDSSLDYLIEKIQLEQNPKVKATALLALAAVDTEPENKETILVAYLKHSDGRVRANALEGLSLLYNFEDRGFFVPYLEDDANRVVGNAIIALSYDQNFSTKYQRLVFNALQRLLAKKERNHNLTALYCMGTLQDVAFLPLLVDQLNQEDEALKLKALEALQSWSLVSDEALVALQEHQSRSTDFSPSSSVQTDEEFLHEELKSLEETILSRGKKKDIIDPFRTY